MTENRIFFIFLSRLDNNKRNLSVRPQQLQNTAPEGDLAPTVNMTEG